MRTIQFHSEQKITPPVKEILSLAVRGVFGSEKVRFEKVDTPDAQTLCFGTRGGIRTMSPKQLLSAPNALSVLEQSLRLAAQEARRPSPDDMVYAVVANEKDFLATVTWMVEVGFEHPICADIENALDGRVLSISVTYGKNIVVFPEEFCQQPHLDKIVHTLWAHYYLIGANWKYDSGLLLDHTGMMVPVWFDTMLAHHSLHPSATGQHGLKQMAERILGVPDWDKDIQKYTGAGSKTKPKDFSKVPRELLYKYNAFDVYYTFMLYEYLIAQTALDGPYWTEQYWANGFVWIENNRVHLDIDAVVNLRDSLIEQENEHETWLAEFGIANVRSPKQILEAFQVLAPGMLKTDKDTLEAFQDHEEIGEAVTHLLEYRRLQKQRATYCDAYLRFEKDGFIHPTINIHGTASGRMSGSDPNVQNVPRDKVIRNLFTARAEDRVLISCDYSQAELRAQAIISGDVNMIAAFQPGAGDYFDLLAPVMFPKDFEDLAAYKVLKSEDKAAAKEFRAKIKGVIYGSGFGRGAAAIGQAIGSTKDEAQTILDNFLNGYPDYKIWRQNVIEAAVDPEKRDFLTGPYNLTFDTEVITWRNRSSVERSALSFLPQNIVSYLCTTAAVRINNRLRREYPDALVVMAVHDDIIVDCPKDLAEPVGKIMQEEMVRIGVETYGDVVLFDAEPESTFRWGALVD